VRYFTLGNPAASVPAVNGTLVRPVQLPGHLHGRKMAVRVGEHEVLYLEDVRWAESLDEAITQQLRSRLGAVASGATVAVHVQSCELVRPAGNQVELAATYVIVPADGDKAAARQGTFTATPRVWDGKDYSTLVDLMHAAIGELGDAIAAALPEKK
jgi:uncharacterized lipoprotein YmbA